MLIKMATLRAIKAGEISVVYRRWRRPTVKAGGQLRTALGILRIHSVDKIPLHTLRASDASEAGYESKRALMEELKAREGDVYKIVIGDGGIDPRLALSEDVRLSEDELSAIYDRLHATDRRSQHGPWAWDVLNLIGSHPRRPASELAEQLGFEKLRLKSNVRKLKQMGLTISLARGYALSPRGVRVLEARPRF